MFWFYLILSAAVDSALVYCKGLVKSAVDIWKPVLIYIGIFLGCIVVHFIAFVLASLTINKNKKVDNIHNFYRWFMVSLLRLFFKLENVKIHVDGEEKIPDDGKFLFVGNHISMYDPIITITALSKKNLAFVSKKENVDIPFAGAYILKAGCVPLDRDNTREAVKAINTAAENISNGVCAMGIYPEGYVNKNENGLLPFRNGAFKIAKKAKVPIVIAAISNTRKINENLLRRRTHIYLKIISVLPFEEIAEMKTNEIGEKVYSILSSAL